MTPSVSILVPTYREASTISALLHNLTELGADEIIVIDGGSLDGTSEIASRFPGARLIHAERGRAVQMNAGVLTSRGDVLLFLHADTRLNPGALEPVRRAMSDPAVAGGNFDIRYDGNDLAAACFTLINRYRCKFGILYGDSGLFCRRSVFQALDGFKPWPILEDYEFGRRLRKMGSLALLDEPIYVSNRRWRRGGLVATMWIWLLIQVLYLLGVSPVRLARLYSAIR